MSNESAKAAFDGKLTFSHLENFPRRRWLISLNAHNCLLGPNWRWSAGYGLVRTSQKCMVSKSLFHGTTMENWMCGASLRRRASMILDVDHPKSAWTTFGSLICTDFPGVELWWLVVIRSSVHASGQVSCSRDHAKLKGIHLNEI